MKVDEQHVLKIAIIAGEESGDMLGAELVSTLRDIAGMPLNLIGVGGTHLAEQGLASLFDPSEIALMGISEIVLKIPHLWKLISTTAAQIIAAKPDVLVIIDNPEFTQRVARKVKAALPTLPVINYVSPTVWAWRPGRAKAMRGYVDHILAILPFEPESIAKLGGPPTTYVGHRLASDQEILSASREQGSLELSRFASDARTVLLLPGSRRGEVRRSMPVLKAVVAQWAARNANYNLVIPTLERLETEVHQMVQDWAIKPKVVVGHPEKMRYFASADAALATSGTVTLELALCSVPTAAFYKTDPMMQFIAYRLFTAWSASLPNLIADEPLIPESYNEQATPGILARQIERLLINGPARQAQVQGFERLYARVQTPEKPSQMAARIVLEHALKQRAPV